MSTQQNNEMPVNEAGLTWFVQHSRSMAFSDMETAERMVKKADHNSGNGRVSPEVKAFIRKAEKAVHDAMNALENEARGLPTYEPMPDFLAILAEREAEKNRTTTAAVEALG